MLEYREHSNVSLKVIFMQKFQTLQFKCLHCDTQICFSVFDLDSNFPLSCSGCVKSYSFNDPILLRQLKKFEALCRQIHESEEILGSACVGVDVGDYHVKVPYKLLLTRLNSSLDLNIEGKAVSMKFRIEPTKDAVIVNYGDKS